MGPALLTASLWFRYARLVQVEIFEKQVLGKGAVGKVCKGKYRVSCNRNRQGQGATQC